MLWLRGFTGFDGFTGFTVGEQSLDANTDSRIRARIAGAPTTFVLESVPSNGKLYQYDASAAGYKGALITASMLPVIVTDEPWTDQANPDCCDDNGAVGTCGVSTGGVVYSWLCPRLVFEGDLDFFSWPTETREGVALNEDDDQFSFHVASTTETSVSANISVRVRNVNDPPTLVLAPEASFAPRRKNTGLLGSILSVTDADRGVGLYQVKLQLSSVNSTLTETSLKQPADGLYRGTASLTYWQWDTRFIEELLGYCPPMCRTTSASKCDKAGCLLGDGLGMKSWFFFVSPATLPSVLEKVEIFTQQDERLTLTVEINDFDDGVCTAFDNAACSYLRDKATCELLLAPSPPPPPAPLAPQESTQQWYESFESFADFVGTAARLNGTGLVLTAYVHVHVACAMRLTCFVRAGTYGLIGSAVGVAMAGTAGSNVTLARLPYSSAIDVATLGPHICLQGFRRLKWLQPK